MVRITSDPRKREKTKAERGLDFEDAAEVFSGPGLTIPDRRRDYAEDRFITFGLLEGRLVVLVGTPRTDSRHVISMRKANDREEKRFGQRLGES